MTVAQQVRMVTSRGVGNEVLRRARMTVDREVGIAVLRGVR